MNAKDVMRQAVESSYMVVGAYVHDLTDPELLVRSVPGSNHIAWQLGHMIGGTRHMLAQLGQPGPELPEGFVTAHSAETAASDDPRQFCTKAEYLALMEKAKAATLAAIDATPDAALDQPGPESMRAYAPTVGATLFMAASHCLMHAGQFVPIRRKLGKGPVF